MSLNWFISVDDHLIEPARLWQERVPERMRSETAPHIVRDGDSEFWVYEDRQIVTTGLNAVAGKKREEFSPEPITYEDMRPGCYDPAARVADMDQGNVLSSMMFPSFPRYCGQVFHEAKDRDSRASACRAWNDFVLEEFADAYPGRFIPMMLIPLWDPAAAVAEIERTRWRSAPSRSRSRRTRPSSGCRRSTPATGTPCSRRRTRPARCSRCTSGSSSNLIRTSDDMPTLAFMSYSAAANQAGTLLDWLFSGKFEQFPELKIALSRGIDRLDSVLPRAGGAGRRQAALLGVALRHRHEPEPRARRGQGHRELLARHRHPAAVQATTSSARSSRTRPASGCSTSSVKTT